MEQNSRTVLATGIEGLGFVQRMILVLKHRNPSNMYYATSTGDHKFNIVRFKQ